MAKRSFWETLKELFREDEVEIITDEQWAEMQAAERKKREELLLDDEPLEVDNSWKCPVCHRSSPEEAVFCIHCGYHPGSFREIIDGKHDQIPESYFLYAGSIDEVVEKWKGEQK